MAAKALGGRAASSRKRRFAPTSGRHDFRVFLLHLGIIGDEFKTARRHLLAALPGDSPSDAADPRRGQPQRRRSTRRPGRKPGLRLFWDGDATTPKGGATPCGCGS